MINFAPEFKDELKSIVMVRGQSYPQYVFPEVEDIDGDKEDIIIDIDQENLLDFMEMEEADLQIIFKAGKVPLDLDDKYLGSRDIDIILEDSAGKEKEVQFTIVILKELNPFTFQKDM